MSLMRNQHTNIERNPQPHNAHTNSVYLVRDKLYSAYKLVIAKNPGPPLLTNAGSQILASRPLRRK